MQHKWASKLSNGNRGRGGGGRGRDGRAEAGVEMTGKCDGTTTEPLYQCFH